MRYIQQHVILCLFFRWFRLRFSHTANQGGRTLSLYVPKMNPRKYGRSSEFASNRLADQELSALSLHVLQICLVYVNTLFIQHVLADPKQLKQMKKEDLRALTPLIYNHVTSYGTFRLNLSKRIQIEEAHSA